MSGVGLRARIAPHAGLAALLLLAMPLLFVDLGGGVLWADEADTAVFAQSILRQGIPNAWDGAIFSEGDSGRRLTSNLVMVGTPWLTYYVTAASFAVLGESTLAARLPFALAGLASVVLLYALVWRATGDRLAALVASILLIGSVQFLLYARECRHYGLNVMLSLALLLAFLRLRERPRGVAFVLAAVALFHTQPLPAGASLAALGALTLVHPAYRSMRSAFWRRLPIVLLLTLPWIWLVRSGWQVNAAPLASVAALPGRWLQFAFELPLAIPWLAWVALLPWAWPRLSASDRAWLALVGALLASYFALTPLLLDELQLFNLGIRYVIALLALGAGASAVLAVRASRGRRAWLVTIVLLLGFTHLGGYAAPWLLIRVAGSPRAGRAHAPEALQEALLRVEWLGFVSELHERDPGTVSSIVQYLNHHALPGDRVITNYDWEPLAFHTGLPQALRILESYPVYADARRAGLPDYVFGVEGARWLVWRWPWRTTRATSSERCSARSRSGAARSSPSRASRRRSGRTDPSCISTASPGMHRVGTSRDGR